MLVLVTVGTRVRGLRFLRVQVSLCSVGFVGGLLVGWVGFGLGLRLNRCDG